MPSATIDVGARSVTFGGRNAFSLVLMTIEGWYGTPDAKVSLTERGQGTGAYPVDPSSVLYSARTVTLSVAACGEGRDEVAALMDSVDALAGGVGTLRVADGESDTVATGYVAVDWDRGPWRDGNTGTVTVVCPDPRRYGAAWHRAYLRPGATSAGGLEWAQDGTHALPWPLSFGGGGRAPSVATLHNAGTSAAYPTITASGDMGGLVLTDTATGAQLGYAGRVGSQPVVLDCLARTASVSGVDSSRLLSSRGFPSVPAGGGVTLALSATGTGVVEVAWRDTYI